MEHPAKAQSAREEYARVHHLEMGHFFNIDMPEVEGANEDGDLICECGSSNLNKDFKMDEVMCEECAMVTAHSFLHIPRHRGTVYDRKANFIKYLEKVLVAPENAHLKCYTIEKVVGEFNRMTMVFRRAKQGGACGALLAKRKSFLSLPFVVYKICTGLGKKVKLKLPKMLKTWENLEIMWGELKAYEAKHM